MHARRVQECAEEGGRGAKKGSPAPRNRTAVAPVRRRARRSQKLTARTRSSSSPPTSRLVSFDRRRPPAKLRKGLWRAKIFSARETPGSSSSYVIHEHCTRPQTPKLRTPPHVPPKVSCWCTAHRARLGASRGAEGSNAGRGARGDAFGSGSRKRGRKGVAAFALGRGGLRVTLGKRGLPSSIWALKSAGPGPKTTGTVLGFATGSCVGASCSAVNLLASG